MCSKLNNRGSSLGYDVRTPSVMLTLSLAFAIKKLMQDPAKKRKKETKKNTNVSCNKN